MLQVVSWTAPTSCFSIHRTRDLVKSLGKIGIFFLLVLVEIHVDVCEFMSIFFVFLCCFMIFVLNLYLVLTKIDLAIRIGLIFQDINFRFLKKKNYCLLSSI